MEFDQVLDAVVQLLSEHGRVAYRGLRRRFDLDDEYIEDIKAELITARGVARDEGGEVLVLCTEAAGDDAATTAGAQPGASAAPTLQAERRHLTVMFCDLVESTVLAGALDPEEFRDLVCSYHEVCSIAVRRYDGHIAQYLGDGLLIYFGYPSAHEDDGARSVHAGLAIIDAVERLNEVTTLSSGRLAVRLGVHTGLVVVGEMGATDDRKEQLALGETPNIAARIQAEAQPGTLVVSGATRKLLGNDFEIINLGPRVLRGVAGQTSLFSAARQRGDRPTDRPQAGFVPLIGRAAEVEMLTARWQRAREGSGQLVSITSEAGLGKSRLVQVLVSRVQGQPHVHWEWRCSSYHQNTPLHPVVTFIERLLRLEHSEGDAARREKLVAVLPMLMAEGTDLQEAAALLGALLGLPHPASAPPLPAAQRRKQRTRKLLVDAIVERSGGVPLLLVVEDLHWADPSTIELLTELTEALPAAPALVVVTTRPGVDPPGAAPGHSTALSLDPLNAVEVVALASNIAGGRQLPQELLTQLVTNTDGVPLFVEELTTMVLEADVLDGSGDDYRLKRPISSLGIPTTLQGSLMARLDRLSSVKSVAQLASVLGREFTYELLQAVGVVAGSELGHELGKLVSAGVLEQRGQPPAASYTFKHALIQEAAYQSLLRRTRQEHHGRVAAALAAGAAGDPAAQAAQLAFHHEAAGEIEEAIGQLEIAGRRSASASAVVETCQQLGHALELLTTTEPSPQRDHRELGLRLAMGAPLIASRGYASPEVSALYSRAQELYTPGVDARQTFVGMWGLFLSAAVRGDFVKAREFGEVLARVASDAGDVGLELESCFALGHAFWTGRLSEGRGHFERGLSLHDRQQHADHGQRFGQDPEVAYASYLSWILSIAGDAAGARVMSERALQRARALSHPHSLGFALAFGAVFEQLQDEPAAVMPLAAEAVALSQEHDLPTWLADGQMLRGWARARLGDADGLVELTHGLDAWDALGAKLWRTHQLVLLADAAIGVGDLSRAEGALEQSARVSQQTGEVYYNAEAERMRGLLSLRSGGGSATARGHFERAAVLAEQNGSMGLHARARESLAQLDAGAGDADAHATDSG